MVTKKEFASKQDHSLLGTYCSRKDVRRFCEETLEYGFPAVYVNPCDVEFAKSIIGAKSHVGTVIGFPQGTSSTENKIAEGIDALDNGADEVDVVINVSRLKDRDLDYVKEELTKFNAAMKEHKPDTIVKVIIECFYLTHEEKTIAAEIVATSGADYIKLSTGTTPFNSYTLGDVKHLKAVVGDRCKVKASGWIITIEDAIGCIEFGADRIGNDHGPQWLNEFDSNRWYK